jgi:hypothetical protein
MDILICRWSNPREEFVAWTRADSNVYTLRYALEKYITYGTTMEILETFTLPDPKQPGYIADRCDYWRKALETHALYRGDQLVHEAITYA